ncbi:MAG: ABC transporter permease [Clostridiaceae bacterium]|nr:ABC transporter permease [Clostridiaceae bacterium]
MNKVFVLLRNEWTKISRKKIVYIILVLTVLGIVALGGIFKMFSHYSDEQIYYSEADSEMEDEILNVESEISNLEELIDNYEQDNTPDQAQDLANLQINLENMQHYKIMLELGLEKNINIFSSDFRRQLISDLADLQLAKEIKLSNSQKANDYTLAYEASPEESIADEIETDTDEASTKQAETVRGNDVDPSDFAGGPDVYFDYYSDIYSTNYYPYDYYLYKNKYTDLTIDAMELRMKNIDRIISQDDYAAFIDYQIDNVKSNQALNEQQKDFQIADLKLELQLNPTGKPNYPGKNYFLSLQYLRNNSFEAINDGYVLYSPLLPVEIEEAKQHYQVANYYLNLPATNPPEADDSICHYPVSAISLGTYAIICLIIILAGSTISQEISTGSIKGLIIAPVKRCKIFFAKVLGIFSISLIGMLIVYLTTLISSYIFVEPFYRLPYVFTTGNGVSALEFPIYLLLLSLSKVSFVFITGTIALMFSSVTRSTSIAVGITMVMQFGLLSIYNFIKLISIRLHPIIAFLPFEYLDLSNYIFPTINNTSYSNFIFFGSNLNREFVLRTPSSLPYLYWLVMVVCFIWIARDSFVKNDL